MTDPEERVKWTAEDAENLADMYESAVEYEPPVWWYQVWRWHRIFDFDYQESRKVDTFLAMRRAQLKKTKKTKEGS